MSDDWKERGLCREVGGDMFFPDEGPATRQAVAICQTCPVAAQCLQYALDNHINVGVWGGTTARDRRRIRKTQPSTAA